MIFHDTIAKEQIIIGGKYSLIGQGHFKNEIIVNIISVDGYSRPIDDYGSLWTSHGFANSITEYWGTQCSSDYEEHRKYCKLILCNKLIRIIPV